MSDMENALTLIKRGSVDFVGEDGLRKKLGSGKTLRVKFGADPTSADLHLGHSVALSKLRVFQDMGHTVALVIGDFTAAIGDPSGRDSTRPVLARDKILENAKTYTRQAFKVLDASKTEVWFNSDWLSQFMIPGGATAFKNTFSDNGKELRLNISPEPQAVSREGRVSLLMWALSKLTVSRLLEREDFKNRMREGNPISMLEILYPVFQGYDSVALASDVELGGSDQLFNLIAGRDMQRDFGQEPQAVITIPLLIGTDGEKKMSKSYGNYIGFEDSPADMFGKVMSVSDSLMWSYYELLTSEDIAAVKAIHPMDAKKKLAGLLVERFHSKEAAQAAREGFENVFSKKELPADMKIWEFDAGSALSAVIYAAGLAPSKKEARRLIEQGAVRLDGEKITADNPVNAGATLQVGRRGFCKISPRRQGAPN